MLGRLRMSVSECIKAYLEMSENVFGKPQNFTHREKFNPDALEQAIKVVVKEKTGDEDAILLDPSCCKTYVIAFVNIQAHGHRFVCTYETKALGGSPVLLRTYETGSAPINCTIWEAARATSAAPTFFPPIKFRDRTGGEFIDAGVGCNNPTKILIKEAKSYYRLKGYTAAKPTCLVSIGTGQKDLIQLNKAASTFWFKDRTGLSIAPILGEIVTDCENTHDEVTLSCIEDRATDLYYRFNVSQGLQEVVLDEWEKADDIRTYTDKYMRLNQTDHNLLECVKLLRSRGDPNPLMHRVEDGEEAPGRHVLQITQGGSEFHGPTTVSGGTVFQGNYIG